MPKCRKCEQDFEKTTSSTWLICSKCHTQYQREYMRDYRVKNPGFELARVIERRKSLEYVEAERKRGRDYWEKRRHECFMAYGGYICACCGETEPKFLSLDHTNNDGSAHRKEIGNRGSGIFTWLKKNGYPLGYQILCMNCNHGKSRNNGICPHKTSSQKQCENGEHPDRTIPCQAREI